MIASCTPRVAPQRSCTVVDEHTNLHGGGLRQLCIETRSRRVLLLDLEGSHAQAAAVHT